jgi:hypothetical protein
VVRTVRSMKKKEREREERSFVDRDLGDDVGGVGEVGVTVLASVDDVARRRREAHQEQPPHYSRPAPG